MNELRRKALQLLARREHSRSELARKLAGQGSTEEIDAVLADLQQRNLLSDVRMTDAYLRSHGARFDAARLRQNLRAKGVVAETIDSGLQDVELPPEIDRARMLWQRKFGQLPTDAKDWARQARFLQSRGFSAATIRALLRGIDA